MKTSVVAGLMVIVGIPLTKAKFAEKVSGVGSHSSSSRMGTEWHSLIEPRTNIRLTDCPTKSTPSSEVNINNAQCQFLNKCAIMSLSLLK